MPPRYRLHSTNTPLVIICKKHVYHTFCIFCNSNSSQVIREGWLDLIPHLSNLNQLAALAIACINGDEAKEEFKRSWSIKEYLQLISQLGVATKAALTDAVAPKLPPNTWTNHWIEISFLGNFFWIPTQSAWGQTKIFANIEKSFVILATRALLTRCQHLVKPIITKKC